MSYAWVFAGYLLFLMCAGTGLTIYMGVTEQPDAKTPALGRWAHRVGRALWLIGTVLGILAILFLLLGALGAMFLTSGLLR